MPFGLMLSLLILSKRASSFEALLSLAPQDEARASKDEV